MTTKERRAEGQGEGHISHKYSTALHCALLYTRLGLAWSGGSEA